MQEHESEANMHYDKLTLAELNKASDDLDAQISALAAEKRELHAVRCQLLAEEEADRWGLTAEEYADCKRESNPAAACQTELHGCMRQIQKFEQRAGDPRKPEAARVAALEEVQKLKAKLPGLQDKAHAALQQKKPLRDCLNEARARKGLEAKKALQATAQPV